MLTLDDATTDVTGAENPATEGATEGETEAISEWTMFLTKDLRKPTAAGFREATRAGEETDGVGVRPAAGVTVEDTTRRPPEQKERWKTQERVSHQCLTIS